MGEIVINNRASGIQYQVSRCAWASSDPLYQKYHDEEWGVHVNDDRKLFEMLWNR